MVEVIDEYSLYAHSSILEDNILIEFESGVDYNVEIINTNNLERWTYGNIDDLPYKGLYLNLLDDENKVRNLIGMVEADDEPQTWRQGDLALLVFRREEKLVCMFYCTSK